MTDPNLVEASSPAESPRGAPPDNHKERLADLRLHHSYRKGTHDIARDFYVPCMERASSYDRAVGYFSSTVYALAWGALKEFVLRGGKIRIVCSPALSLSDIEALEEGYEEANAERLRDEVERLLADPRLRKPTRVLAALVAVGALEFRVAFVGPEAREHRRIFHDKVGIFADSEEARVVFKGSMNETWSGLSLGGNLESVDVYASWLGDARESLRVDGEVAYFEKLWDGDFPGVKVTPFPEVARDRLIDAADPANWPSLIDEVCTELEVLEAARSLVTGVRDDERKLRPHQADALAAWVQQGRRGILEHATGSGKTFTALSAIDDALRKGEVPLILVPSKLLFEQWEEELRTTLKVPGEDGALLRCGNGHMGWRRNERLGAFTHPGSRPRVVLAMMPTAATTDFLDSVEQGDHLFVVADEVHRMGSPGNLSITGLQSGPRLGLSATPRRAGDPEGTVRLFDYFGGIIEPPFTLEDAIEAGVLTRYVYRPYTLNLTDSEQDDWDRLSGQIRQSYARDESARQRGQLRDGARVKRLLIERARVAKGAVQKVPLAVDVVREHYCHGQRWLVYCDTQDQLHAVRAALRSAGFDASDYHRGMGADADQTLRHFEVNGGILVSIRCLDEGVDIPQATHALILASSRNPREFIQRRGRVLRKFPGKRLAHVYDALVLPPDSIGDTVDTGLLEGELARAITFGRGAVGYGSVTDLERIAIRFGLDRQSFQQTGYEDDSEDT